MRNNYGKKQIKTFSENIKDMFTKYAIIPVFITTLACMFLFIGFWQYTIYKSSSQDNKKIANHLEETITDYSLILNNLTEEDNLFKEDITSDSLVDIYRMMYKMNFKTGYSADLYLFDINLTPLLVDDNEQIEFLANPSNNNWGVLNKINNNPQNISLNLSSDATKTLYLGRGALDKGELIGYVIIGINTDEFQKLLASVGSQTITTDDIGWVYMTDSYAFQDELGRIDREIIYRNGYISFNNRLYYLSSSSILNDMLHIYSFTDNAIQVTVFLFMLIVIIVIFLAITIMINIMSGKVTKKTTQGIDDIAYAFEEARKGNLSCRLSIDSSLELKQIGDSYNSMVEGLNKYIKENQELTEHVAFAQVKQLEAQFNPHFLFNTLDNIRFVAKIDSNIADKMIVSMSKLLRYSISDASEEVTVEEDMKNTESYLTILKLRFNKRFTYEVSVQDSIRQCTIPKLMMQSLIENAVKYGYSDGEKLHVEKLHVSIIGYEEDGDLIFVCKDDGVGIKADLLEKIKNNLLKNKNTTNHHGIYNINKRIQLMYKGDYGIKLESELGVGTCVTLTMPSNNKRKVLNC